MAGAHQVAADVLDRADQIAEPLVLGAGYERETNTGGEQPCEPDRLAAIGLDPIVRASRDRARRHHPKIDPRERAARAARCGHRFLWKPKTWKRARHFVVRRDPLEQGEKLSLEGAEWHYWALVTNDEERSADALEVWHREKANVEN